MRADPLKPPAAVPIVCSLCGERDTIAAADAERPPRCPRCGQARTSADVRLPARPWPLWLVALVTTLAVLALATIYLVVTIGTELVLEAAKPHPFFGWEVSWESYDRLQPGMGFEVVRAIVHDKHAFANPTRSRDGSISYFLFLPDAGAIIVFRNDRLVEKKVVWRRKKRGG